MTTAEATTGCACWANIHALGHGGHCCFVHGDRKVNNGFHADEDICHVPPPRAKGVADRSVDGEGE